MHYLHGEIDLADGINPSDGETIEGVLIYNYLNVHR